MDLLRRRDSSGLGHERRYRDVRGASGLPPTPERLRQHSEPTFRAMARKSLRSSPLRGDLTREAQVTSREDCDGASGTCAENQGVAILSQHGAADNTNSVRPLRECKDIPARKLSGRSPPVDNRFWR
jgi:hypothetical protein